MGLLDGQVGRVSFLDRITFKGMFCACGVAFIVSVVAFPMIGFGAFSAQDKDGWIMGLMMLVFAIGAFSGLLLLVMGVVALMQRRAQ